MEDEGDKLFVLELAILVFVMQRHQCFNLLGWNAKRAEHSLHFVGRYGTTTVLITFTEHLPDTVRPII